MKRLLETLLRYDKEVLGFIKRIPISCLDVLPWIPEKQFICPVYSSNPFVSLVKEVFVHPEITVACLLQTRYTAAHSLVGFNPITTAVILSVEPRSTDS